jgi:hypothetical protein
LTPVSFSSKTAEQIGLMIPQWVLMRADRVIKWHGARGKEQEKQGEKPDEKKILWS